MNRRHFISLLVVAIVLASGAFYTQRLFVESFLPSQEMPPDSFTFTAKTESTVLDTMKALSADGSLSFSGRDFRDLGFFVEEINGKRNGSGYYWILSINGKKSDLGVSSAQVKAGDLVKWRYEKGY